MSPFSLFSSSEAPLVMGLLGDDAVGASSATGRAAGLSTAVTVVVGG